MFTTNFYLGLILFSFLVNSAVIVPFINFLYKVKFTRRVQAEVGKKKQLFDQLHDWKAGTPLGGGVLVIALTVVLYLLVVIIYNTSCKKFCIYSFTDEVNVLMLTFIGFGALGLYDDWIKTFGKPEKGFLGGAWLGISSKTKFILQWILALIISSLLFYNLKIDFINIPRFDIVVPLGILYVPFAAFIIVTFTNAYNFTDGLDGLATGLLLVALTAFMAIASSILDLPLSIFLGIWIGSLIAFLYFNVFPARIWLGDAGALSFGATLAVVGLLTGKVFALLFIGGIFIFEAFSSLIQIIAIRVFHKRVFPIAPFHLTLQKIGWPEPKIVMRAWIAAALLAIFGLWLA